jgi:hypothetical protein
MIPQNDRKTWNQPALELHIPPDPWGDDRDIFSDQQERTYSPMG